MIMSNVKKLLMLSVLLSPSAVFAAEGTIDGPATVWLMVSIVIVLLMFIPGLALFYGGMVRAKISCLYLPSFCDCRDCRHFMGGRGI